MPAHELQAFDETRPNAARMYDYYLGGHHNLAVDREAAVAAEAAWPGVQATARANRSFLRRVVHFLAVDCGIDQFLDLGSGVPTVGNVHEIAQKANPNARVVYVDNEPVAVKASQILLDGVPGASIVAADLRDPDDILAEPEVRRLIDFTRPVAVMLVSVLHFVPDDAEVEAVTRAYAGALASGSFLTLSHYSDPSLLSAPDSISGTQHANDVYKRSTNPAVWRSLPVIEGLFGGLELVEPGVTHIMDWRPDGDEGLAEWRDRTPMHGGVARKP